MWLKWPSYHSISCALLARFSSVESARALHRVWHNELGLNGLFEKLLRSRVVHGAETIKNAFASVGGVFTWFCYKNKCFTMKYKCYLFLFFCCCCCCKKIVYVGEKKSENANVPSRSECLCSYFSLNEWRWKGQTPYSCLSDFLEMVNGQWHILV